MEYFNPVAAETNEVEKRQNKKIRFFCNMGYQDLNLGEKSAIVQSKDCILAQTR